MIMGNDVWEGTAHKMNTDMIGEQFSNVHSSCVAFAFVVLTIWALDCAGCVCTIQCSRPCRVPDSNKTHDAPLWLTTASWHVVHVLLLESDQTCLACSKCKPENEGNLCHNSKAGQLHGSNVQSLCDHVMR